MVQEEENTPDRQPPEVPENADAGEVAPEPRPGTETPAPEQGTFAAGDGDGAAQEADLDAIMQELGSAKRQAAERMELALRTQAELENLRRRTARDVENAHKYALERFLGELLPVLDSLELGIEASAGAGDIDSLREGMDLTLKKFQDILGKFGISPVNPQGERFNPERHEAVSMQEQEGVEAGTVLTVMQKGYELNGRLVRPAMVVVAR